MKPPFSRRTAWDRSSNTLAERLEVLRRAGTDLIDLTESNPTRCGFDYPPEILTALASEEMLRYEPDPLGLLAAREAVAEHLRQEGSVVRSDALLLCASTSEAYAFLFKLLCDPGDSVLVPRPSYPLFDFLTELESVRVRSYVLPFEGSWRIDLDSVREATDEQTRAVLVVNPANPTGQFLKAQELEALSVLCEERGWALIVDEVFSDYSVGMDAGRVRSVAGREAKCLTFALSGLSKVAALPQLKVAWMVVSGPGGDEALRRLEVIADTYLSVATPVQQALPALLRLAPRMQCQIRERVQTNRAALARAISGPVRWSLLPSEGGWYAVLRLPLEPGEEATCLRCLDAGVVVQPGYFFDFPSGAWLVLSLLPPSAVFDEGLRRLSGVLSA